LKGIGVIMELKFLGRGSAFNVKESNTSAYIKENNTLFLIDCGSNIFERIIQRNLLYGVKNIYVAITHRHPDHIGSLGDLIFYCYYVLHIKVNILDNDYKNIYKCLLLNGVTSDKYEFWHHTFIDELNMIYYFEETEHCHIYQSYCEDFTKERIEEDVFPCHSLILKLNNGKSIFYSGDTSFVDFETHDFENEYYVDCCIANYPNNVHYNVDKLHWDCELCNIDISKVWCMHFDNDTAIARAKELGFNIVVIES